MVVGIPVLHDSIGGSGGIVVVAIVVVEMVVITFVRVEVVIILGVI